MIFSSFRALISLPFTKLLQSNLHWMGGGNSRIMDFSNKSKFIIGSDSVQQLGQCDSKSWVFTTGYIFLKEKHLKIKWI